MGRKYTVAKCLSEYPHLRGGTVVDPATAQKKLEELNSLGPGERLRMLNDRETIALLGAAQCSALRKQAKRHNRIGAIVCSSAWLVAAWEYGEEYPPGGIDRTGMVLSQFGSRIGEENVLTRRWTPAIAGESEDQLDGMSVGEADRYHRPASPSAVVIGQIGMRKATERLVKLRLSKAEKARKKQARDRAEEEKQPRALKMNFDPNRGLSGQVRIT